LLAKALIWCHLQAIPILSLGILKANPFPDASPAFFVRYEDVVNRAMGGKVKIERPYAHLAKAEVLRRGQGLPLGLTVACLRPEAGPPHATLSPTGGEGWVRGRHCGRCNKCAERRRAFVAAGIADPTDYATEESCTR